MIDDNLKERLENPVRFEDEKANSVIICMNDKPLLEANLPVISIIS
jgi:hypothetical protein